MWPVWNASPNCVVIRTGGLWCNSVTSLQVTHSFYISTGHCELFWCCVMVFSYRASWISHRSTLCYTPSRFANFRCSDLHIHPKSPLLQLFIQQNFISRASENPLQLPLHLLTLTRRQPPSQNDSVCCLPPLFLTSLVLFTAISMSTFFTHSLLTNYVIGLM